MEPADLKWIIHLYTMNFKLVKYHTRCMLDRIFLFCRKFRVAVWFANLRGVAPNQSRQTLEHSVFAEQHVSPSERHPRQSPITAFFVCSFTSKGANTKYGKNDYIAGDGKRAVSNAF